MYESMRLGLAELDSSLVYGKLGSQNRYSQFNDTAVGADIQDLALELVGEEGDRLEMLVLETHGLAHDELARVEVGRLCDIVQLLLDIFAFGLGRDLAVVCQQLFKVLGAKDVDLGEEQLALDERGIGVVQHSPDGDQVLELSARLLNNGVLAREHDGHAGEVRDLGVADDQTVDVEAASGENAGDAGEHTGLVLNEAVEGVALGRQRGGRGRLVEDVGDGGLGGPRRRLLRGERRDAAMQRLICERRGGGGRRSAVLRGRGDERAGLAQLQKRIAGGHGDSDSPGQREVRWMPLEEEIAVKQLP